MPADATGSRSGLGFEQLALHGVWKPPSSCGGVADVGLLPRESTGSMFGIEDQAVAARVGMWIIEGAEPGTGRVRQHQDLERVGSGSCWTR